LLKAVFGKIFFNVWIPAQKMTFFDASLSKGYIDAVNKN